jgi:hypothetical protein
VDYLTAGHVDAAYSGVRQLISQNHEDLDAMYQVLRASLNLPALEYCLRSFIVAELDCLTDGERGLGRVTTAVPRLGAYCRGQINALAPGARWELYFLIQELILRGYLTMSLFVDDPKPACVSDAQAVFRAWLPTIYGGDGTLSPDFSDLLAGFEGDAFERVDAFFGLNRMPSVYDQSAKTGEIVWRYAKSGANLRAAECGLHGGA